MNWSLLDGDPRVAQKHLFSEPSKRPFGRLKNQPVAEVGVQRFLEPSETAYSSKFMRLRREWLLPRLVSVTVPVCSPTDLAVGNRFSVVYSVFYWLQRAQVGKNGFQVVVGHVPEVLPRHDVV